MNNVYESEGAAGANSQPPESFGYLQISVAAALRGLPVQNATVSVYGTMEESEADLLAVQVTNASGLTAEISLPAPLLANSLNPEVPNPYNNFYVRIVADKFVTRDKLPVQIFPGVISRLVINLQTPA